MQRDRLAETAAVALQQGRTVLVIEADSKHTPEPVSGTLTTDKRRWTEKPALPVNGTVIVTGAETWSLKETVQLFAQAKETNTQILLLDSAGRKGTGMRCAPWRTRVLSVLPPPVNRRYRRKYTASVTNSSVMPLWLPAIRHCAGRGCRSRYR
ncbi:hypothetical protein [Morganella morganii]|uniref:ssDNA-binding domain-containing protein n=1 Tax=Morganella morganii TaxID=582 RepID=UPI00356B6D71